MVHREMGSMRMSALRWTPLTVMQSAHRKMCISQKRIQAKNVNDENEKYALRTWLIRLGMNGSDFPWMVMGG